MTRKKKVKLLSHAKQRLCERTNYNDYNLTPSKIKELITRNNIIFAKKLTVSRSLCYVNLNIDSEEVCEPLYLKFILRRSDNEIITFLPLEFDYAIATIYKDYYIHFFPDFFFETLNLSQSIKVFKDGLSIKLTKDKFRDLATNVVNNYLSNKDYKYEKIEITNEGITLYPYKKTS